MSCGVKRSFAVYQVDKDLVSQNIEKATSRRKVEIDFRKVHLTMLKSLYEKEIQSGSKSDMFCSLSRFLTERRNLLSICSNACLMDEIESETMIEKKKAINESKANKDILEISETRDEKQAPNKPKMSPMPSLNYMFASPINERFQQERGQTSFNASTGVICSKSTWNFVGNIVKMQRKQIHKSKDEAIAPFKYLMSSVITELTELKHVAEKRLGCEEIQAEMFEKIELWELLLSTMKKTFG